MRRLLWPGLLAVVSVSHFACGGRDGFGKPTDVAFLSDGRPVISDGYINSRVVRYGMSGGLETEWGHPGCGPGELDIPHGVTVDDQDRVYVADRSNARVQVFDRDGNVLDVWPSSEVGRPWGVEYRDGVVFVLDGGDQDPDQPFSRVVLMSTDGQRLSTFGSTGGSGGQFPDGHDIAVDSRGAVYVGALSGRLLQKFVRSP